MPESLRHDFADVSGDYLAVLFLQLKKA